MSLVQMQPERAVCARVCERRILAILKPGAQVGTFFEQHDHIIGTTYNAHYTVNSY
jgi:hypothetical protein